MPKAIVEIDGTEEEIREAAAVLMPVARSLTDRGFVIGAYTVAAEESSITLTGPSSVLTDK